MAPLADAAQPTGMGFRVPTSARRPFRIDLATGALLALGGALLSIAPAFLRRGLDAPGWLIGPATGLAMSTQLLAPLWAGASHRQSKVPFVKGGAYAAGASMLLAALLVGLIVAAAPGAARSPMLLGASPGALLLFGLVATTYLGISGFHPLLASAYNLNYPVMVRARVISRLKRFHFAVALPLSLMAALLVKAPAASGDGGAGQIAAASADRRFLWLLAVAGLAFLAAGLVYGRQRIAGEEGYPRGINLGELRRRMQPGHFAQMWRENPHYARFQIFQFLHGAGNIICIPAFFLVATDQFHLDYVTILILHNGLPNLVVIATTTLWAPLVDRVSPPQARTVNSPFWILGWGTFFVATMTGWLPLAFVARTFAGLAMGGSQLIWGLCPLYYALRKDDVAHLMGAHNYLVGIRGLVVPVVGGALYLWIGNWVFLIGAGMMVVSLVGFQIQARIERRDPEFQAHLRRIGAAQG